jgi:hypothetical protein
MKHGVSGYRPTVLDDSYNTPAGEFGFRQGDIILSVNDQDVRRSSELNKFTTDILSIDVFSKGERRILTINRKAIETEKANRIEAERKAAVSIARQPEYTNEQVDNSPSLKFDDKTLEKRYGKSTPEQLAREKQRAVSTDMKDQKELSDRRAQIEQQREREQLQREKSEIAQKLAKTSCNGIYGECGPGRSCITITQFGESHGICKDSGEAEDIVSNFRANELNRKLNNIESAARASEQAAKDAQKASKKVNDRLDRNFGYGF